ncbi:photosystem II manganese-stabilizing polypeptide [Anabaena sp. FACHB-1250]|uniref:Photosystem II extrinsic protein O n=2 Tax=Dolichospermum TaxID=748770 RepID=A0A480AFF7_9CYAN|nr:MULTISPECIES: photosystem II manganese-stabilizing polypeptide [Nostocales]MBD2143041.1 photosystem II manganese-stabilizing polypeptide [Anabaena sp. FACHB-1250]MBD2270357.1 photosystem II manganese-stabilizing polypeptide [Anabaena sp. FACHB-1391]MBE9220824.1 photosystem II manganese-stabilizing polypeptide [Dolichospermum flos-aquae LEGE 04289]GCL43747.1 photosystem II manganese-stabilizing protein PsbO [Dolichospermum planctonicum]
MRYRALIVAFFALCLGLITACSDAPSTSVSDVLTYEQIRGTGLANKCPQLTETSRGSIAVAPNVTYSIKELCLEPTNFFVKEEPANKRQEAEFVPGKVMTRYTSSIDQVQGKLTVNSDNSLTFTEEDGLDFQAITVKLPGGELVPFLFTIKNLVAQTQPNLTSINTSTDFEGTFKVPSYRGAAFLDPKGRGVVSGYDNAVALPAQADEEELTRTNVKRAEILNGKISLQVAKVDNTSGEIAGTFESEQPSDTDLGAGEPKEVKIRGLFYGRIEPRA